MKALTDDDGAGPDLHGCYHNRAFGPESGRSALTQAYRQAIYRVGGTPPVDLQLERPNLALQALERGGGVVEGAFITACNPHSRRLRAAANLRRMRALQREIERSGYHWAPAVALDPQGGWPPEPSVWVPGLSQAAGETLARRFGQNAFVACDDQGVARLVWVMRRVA